MTAAITSLVSCHLSHPPPLFVLFLSPATAHELQSPRNRPRMAPPSDTPAPSRLAVLLAHLLPHATARLASAERRGTAATAAAEAGAGPSASPCASNGRDGGEGEGKPSGGERCVFCNIVAGSSPAFKLYEDDTCLCILDAKPLTPGHSLIIPKSHYLSLQTTPPPVLAAVCSKLPLLSTAIMKATQCDAFNVLINNGEKAGQVIFHTHIHIIPRSKDDNLWSSETYSRNLISYGQETKNLVDRIKEVLSSTPKDCSSSVTPSTTKEL